MRATKIFGLAGLVGLCGLLTFGCVDDFEDVVLEQPGVIQEDVTYWVGDVMVTQRQTVIRSYDSYTHHFRGSVKNYGTTDLTNARFEIHAWDVIVDHTGARIRQDEEVGATQSMGTLAAQAEMPINLSYTYSSYATRDIEGQFTSD